VSRKHTVGGDLNFILYVLQEKKGESVVEKVMVVQVVTKVSVIQNMVQQYYDYDSYISQGLNVI